MAAYTIVQDQQRSMNYLTSLRLVIIFPILYDSHLTPYRHVFSNSYMAFDGNVWANSSPSEEHVFTFGDHISELALDLDSCTWFHIQNPMWLPFGYILLFWTPALPEPLSVINLNPHPS